MPPRSRRARPWRPSPRTPAGTGAATSDSRVHSSFRSSSSLVDGSPFLAGGDDRRLQRIPPNAHLSIQHLLLDSLLVRLAVKPECDEGSGVGLDLDPRVIAH